VDLIHGKGTSMKAKKKSLKLTVTLPPHLGGWLVKHAKHNKITKEQAVHDLVYLAAMADSCWQALSGMKGKIKFS
jgi:hypothetical protein